MNSSSNVQVRLQWSDDLTPRQRDASRAVLNTARVKRWITTALAGAGEMTVRIVGAAEGRALNQIGRAHV